MKTYAIMRVVNNYERENGLQPENAKYTTVVTCPTKENAEKLLKAIEKYSFLAYLHIEEK